MKIMLQHSITYCTYITGTAAPQKYCDANAEGMQTTCVMDFFLVLTVLYEAWEARGY